MAKQEATIVDQGDGTFVLTLGSYNKEVVEALKEAIPFGDRSYDPSTYGWTIDDDYAEEVEDIVHTITGEKVSHV